MKRLFITLCIIGFISSNTTAQKPVFVREFPMQYLNNDSMMMYFDGHYLLMEDSCAAIIRRGHFNSDIRKFTGPFEDRNRLNQRQLVARGAYNQYGLREGNFSMWYLNGKLQARGSFRNNWYIGIWDFYYPSGKPQLTFEVTDTVITILNAWDKYGTRMVKNGNGTYEFLTSSIVWRGKIMNGRPHGRWMAGLPNFREPGVLATEVFINGVFQQGGNRISSYKDSSRINFLEAVSLPLITAERLTLASNTCNDRYSSILIVAYPANGRQQFVDELNSRLTPVLRSMDTTAFNKWVNLPMKIMEDGKIITDSAIGTNIKIVSTLQAALLGLPVFTPTTVDGKAITQGMMIGVTYNNNEYHFDYGFLPTKIDDIRNVGSSLLHVKPM